MSFVKYSIYYNDIPRYSLGIVFLWFAIDKFLLHDFYLSWFSATQRTQIFVFDNPGLSIYVLGVIELIFATLLFAGIKIRWVSLATIAFLTLVLFVAQYPSSFPQDIGLVGIAIMLVITNVSWGKANTDIFLKYLWIVRYSLVIVLIFWSIDQILNTDRHIGWLLLSSPFELSENTNIFLMYVILVEVSLATMLGISNKKLTKYSLVAVTIFFIFARVVLGPPLNNHQTVVFAIVSAWLSYIAFSKNRI